MNRKPIPFQKTCEDLCAALKDNGAFLVGQNAKGKPNPMTIGWATLGVIWSEPILTVLVRPSRYTFELLEKSTYFSVCVPASSRAMKKELEFCGTRSGRDCDKAKECPLSMVPGITHGVSVIEGCGLFYECETVHKTHVLKESLDPGIISRYYPKGDFHDIYFGKILQTYQSA